MATITVVPFTKKEKELHQLFEQLCALPQCIFVDKYLTEHSGVRNAAVNMISGQAVVLYRETNLFGGSNSNSRYALALCLPSVVVGGDMSRSTYCDLNPEQAQRIVELWDIQAKHLHLGVSVRKELLG